MLYIFRLIKADVDPAVAVLVSPDIAISRDTLDAATAMLAFHLQAVAECAMCGDGVGGCLDLLLQWRPESPLLASRCTLLHYALLALIYAHCTR